MAIRDSYTVRLTNGLEHKISATRQGGVVDHGRLAGDESFIAIEERTANGTTVRSLLVSRDVIESILFTPG